MIFSISETRKLFSTAAIGAGLSIGSARALAEASIWTAQHYYDGAAAILFAIQRCLDTEVLRPMVDNGLWVFSCVQVANGGLSVMEYLVAEKAEAKAQPMGGHGRDAL